MARNAEQNNRMREESRRQIMSLANCGFDTTPCDSGICNDLEMSDLVILFVHVIATLARLLVPGGLRLLMQ
jgi:hypothetical protein